MGKAEITLREPRSWHLALASLAESADYPSLNAILLEALDMVFDLPKKTGWENG